MVKSIRRGSDDELLIFDCEKAPLRGQQSLKPPALPGDTYWLLSGTLVTLWGAVEASIVVCRPLTGQTLNRKAVSRILEPTQRPPL